MLETIGKQSSIYGNFSYLFSRENLIDDKI